MTENEARIMLSHDASDVVRVLKSSAGRLIVNAVMTRKRHDHNSDAEYYASIFNDVKEIMNAYALEIDNAHGGL